MQTTEEIKLDGGGLSQLAQRAVLRPLKPRDAQEAQAVPAKLQQLAEKAAADNHPVIAPTHCLEKGGEIIGYFSIGGLPTVQAWFDSQHKHAADSLKMIEHLETILREQGVRMFAVACAPESPFSTHMERLGFRKMGTTVLWGKEI
jgi:hypothetical protein